MELRIYGEEIKQDAEREEIKKCRKALAIHKKKSAKLLKYISAREDAAYKKRLH